DEDDVTSTDTTTELKSINLITGTTVGTWIIVPGAFFSDNFDISYTLGSLTITPADLTVTADDKSPDCFGTPLYSATVKGYKNADSTGVNASSGPSFTLYDASNAQVGSLTQGGTYSIVPSDFHFPADSNYTISYVNGTLIVPDPVQLDVVVTNAQCYGGTGSVVLTGNGGHPPFSFGGDPTSGLTVGPHSFTITDQSGCSTTATATITQPSKVEAVASSTDATCGLNNGSLNVTTSGGTAPYSYEWSPGGQTTSSVLSAGVGNYTVTVTDAAACTVSASATILSTGTAPGAAGNISGPAGACRNTTGIVYSIAPVAGATSYQWVLPNGVTGSSTTNSITLSFGGSNFVGGFICVIPQNLCGNGSSACLNVPVLNVKPGVPGTITGAFPSCGPATYTYSIPTVVNATNYVWSVSGSGVSITSGQGTNSIEVFIPSGMGQGTISVYAQNCFGNGSARSAYLTGVPTHSNALVGPGFVCPNSTNVAYSMGQVNGTGSYIWTISGNATIASSNGPNCTVNFASNWTSGILSVTTVNACGSFTRTYTIQSVPAQPGSITGPGNNLCGQSNVTYSIAAVAGATSYEWTLPAGVTPLTSLNGTSITVNFTSGFTSTGNICVAAVNSCGPGVPRCYSVTARPAAIPTINGSASVCKTSVQTYSVAPVTGATSYSWSVVGGASIIPGGVNSTLNFNTSLSTTQTIKVNANNACGAGQPAAKAVTVNMACRTAQDELMESDNYFGLYPNPSKDKVTAQVNSLADDDYILKVTDLLGNVILEEKMKVKAGENRKELDLSGLKQGMYFVSWLKEGAEVNTIRLVLN
ncbi:MAG TPA: T9SS type A sorting domain-containing protein, partial [Bacteroidia bacterium]|nr:T9SS type A sorting domain-containing protein [Bacteroidia bacterium]